MLEHARQEALRLDRNFLPVLVHRLDDDRLQAPHLDTDAGHAQAAFFLRQPARPVDDTRVGELVEPVTLVDYYEGLADPDLRRGEPDPRRLVHQLGHPAQELPVLLGYLAHLADHRAQDRVTDNSHA